MSQEPGGFLQMNASYNFDRNKLNNYKHKTIACQSFQKWTQPNMYKSSYAHYHSKDSVQPRNTAIPGYAGYIPSVKAQNIHAKGYSSMAKQSFNQDKLGRNMHGLATTGYNFDKNAVIDHSRIASSSKYGKSQIQKAHPGWNSFWRSTTHQTFKAPEAQLDPTYRPTEKHVQTHKLSTKSSGFATNYAFQDGKGWKADPILKGDNNRSEYRDRLNADHPFHRNSHLTKLAQLPRKEYYYRFN